MTNQTARTEAIAATVDAIREIADAGPISAESLGAVKHRLMQLAANTGLFTAADFPPPTAADPRNSCLYRIAEDEDHRFALYVNSAIGAFDTPPHNHTTWAVIAGIRGEENNRFYVRDSDNGVQQTGGDVVAAGKAVAFLPDELHSIHIDATEPVINFHMYGLALEQLHERQYYSAKDREWRVFPAHTDIREARSGQPA